MTGRAHVIAKQPPVSMGLVVPMLIDGRLGVQVMKKVSPTPSSVLCDLLFL